MVNLRNYIEELTGRVEESRKAGQSLGEMQQRITVASLKSLHSNGYEDYRRDRAVSNSPFSKLPPLQSDVNGNIADVYRNLDRA